MKEIERKYLVADSSYRELARSSSEIEQGYLSRVGPGSADAATVRVRRRGDKGYITVKGVNRGIERDEWEYAIPGAEAAEMLSRLGVATLSKTRYLVDYEGFTWEVDEFHGRHQGLVIAEVELPSADIQPPLPPFAGREVTGDERYYNSNLI